MYIIIIIRYLERNYETTLNLRSLYCFVICRYLERNYEMTLKRIPVPNITSFQVHRQTAYKN